MADCLEIVAYNYQFLLLFYLRSQIHRSGILNSLHVPWLHVVIFVYLALVGTCTCNAVEHRLILQPPRSDGQLVIIVCTELWLEQKLAVTIGLFLYTCIGEPL